MAINGLQNIASGGNIMSNKKRKNYKLIMGGGQMQAALKESTAVINRFESTIGDVSNDEFLLKMKQNGQKLKKILGINHSDVKKALKEVRDEWK